MQIPRAQDICITGTADNKSKSNVAVSQGRRNDDAYASLGLPWSSRRCRCTPQLGGTVAPVAALQPGMARVWVLRQTSSGADLAASNPNNPLPFAGGADPIVYANGAPLAPSAQGTVYYHDFPPGTYHFAVQPYGTRPTTSTR
jgi:hypothetical protein